MGEKALHRLRIRQKEDYFFVLHCVQLAGRVELQLALQERRLRAQEWKKWGKLRLRGEPGWPKGALLTARLAALDELDLANSSFHTTAAAGSSQEPDLPWMCSLTAAHPKVSRKESI